MNSNLSSMPPLPKASSTITIVMLVLAFLAFADAAYLTVEHYRGAIPPCTLSGCEAVLTSGYSIVLGIPTSLWGMLYAFAVFFLVLVFRRAPTPKRALLLVEILGAGLVGSLLLVYIQAFVLRAFCQYCLAFEALIALLFIASLFLRYSVRALWQPPGNFT